VIFIFILNHHLSGLPKNLFFSLASWNLPCPNFDEVSMNLRSTFSVALLEV